MHKCLFCYKKIEEKEFQKYEFHKLCCRKIFNSNIPPLLDYTQKQMFDLADKIIKMQRTIPGVQAKLSLTSNKINIDNSGFKKLTIVGVRGEYILKPQSEFYQELPEIEDLTMKLAQLSKIKTVTHSLIRLKSGELAYITKRIDRLKNRKLHMEDMCQLTERLTEYKYKGSYEQIAKIIKKYASNSGFDIINFYELVLFCFLTGNNDMHLKNFSLLKGIDNNYNLSAAYDLVASELVVENDNEELALNLNGKKRKLKKSDFKTAMKTSNINERAIDNIFNKFIKIKDKWHELIDYSFLSSQLKENYHQLINQKFNQLDMH